MFSTLSALSKPSSMKTTSLCSRASANAVNTLRRSRARSTTLVVVVPVKSVQDAVKVDERS